MNAEQFRATIESQLLEGADLEEMHRTLRTFADCGGTRAEAAEILNALLNAERSEASDDRIRELLDFVAGFCHTRSRIW